MEDNMIRKGCMIGPGLNPGESWITKQSYNLAKAIGAPLIRHQITTWDDSIRNFMTNWDDWFSGMLNDTESVINEKCPSMNTKVIIDFHTPYQGGATLPDCDGAFRNDFVEDVWISDLQDIATRFKNNPYVLGYDIFNEPKCPTIAKYNKAVTRAHDAIRAISPTQKIIIESPWGNPDKFKGLKKFQDKNVWYSFHFYLPNGVTYQGFDKPVGSPYYPNGSNIEKLRLRLKEVYAFKAKYPKAKIFVGEFGCSYKSGFPTNENRLQWYRDCITMWNEKKYHWTFHALGEHPIWDPRSIWSDGDPVFSTSTEAYKIFKTEFAK